MILRFILSSLKFLNKYKDGTNSNNVSNKDASYNDASNGDANYESNNNSNASNNDANNNSSTMKKECQVCFEYHSTSLFSKITAKCDHRLDICELCVSNHISTQLNSKGIGIECPFDGCRQKLQHNDVKRFVNKTLFERFDTLLLRQTLNKFPEFRWCKNSKCNSGQIHFGKGNNNSRIFFF
jgi:hypothetical protein